MKKHFALLQSSSLFRGFSDTALENLLNTLDIHAKKFYRDSSVATEGEPCDHIGIILEGQVELYNLYPSGKIVTITHMGPGEPFGEALLFSTPHCYPISITASMPTEILYISRQALLLGLAQDPLLLENFLNLLSGKLFMLNRRVRILSMDSLRQKICDYLLALYKTQKNKTLQIPINRQKLADLLSVQRPSLSRELIHMKEEGLIDYSKTTITLLDLESIELEL